MRLLRQITSYYKIRVVSPELVTGTALPGGLLTEEPDVAPLLTWVRTWRLAGCVGAGPQGSAAGGGIAGVMPEVGRAGRGCPGTGELAGD